MVSEAKTELKSDLKDVSHVEMLKKVVFLEPEKNNKR